LVGAYVNEDWPQFYDDVWAAVDDYIESAPTLASSLPSDIETVLREFPTDEALERYLWTSSASAINRRPVRVDSDPG
jgi:hypothetical protein